MITEIAHCRLLPTTAEEEWALNPDVASAAVEEDLAAGLIPFFLCATVGTTSSCAVDPLRPLGELSQRHGLWCALHMSQQEKEISKRRKFHEHCAVAAPPSCAM